ncbi:peptide ABC transporter ATP-binding protein [miscellaneous Crenarchaeota group-15 archaeon DG-45]|uniref:Peptide ABC transporter ATP-binding protein n=1 Tax=miscellaneous Crenarchaeota group-15 archaeon DG-45 TaxID=1685127 RepID=A0A0M0BPA4_9ARCH|nr:MAG: peptide ABC transporter ATP-binding protein [miscellaneous Crenarchaeota group-15 archaeon DG-45]
MKGDVLSVRNLKTYFYTSTGTVKAVDGINLDINRGEAVGLVGESGCGKSCTALSIMRLIPIPGKTIDGQVLYKDREILSLSEREMRQVRGREIAMIFQDPFTFLNPLMKVGDQISENILTHQRISRTNVIEEILELLKRVRMPTPERVASFYPHELSGGMRQRVVAAMAIASEPSLLIADEPTTALDVTIQRQILQLITQLKEELDLSLLLISHDLGIVAETCDRVYVMYAGKVVESASIYALFEEPKHPYTHGLINSALSIERYQKEIVGIGGAVPNLVNPPAGCRFHPRCSRAMPICGEKEPQMIEVGEQHLVACHLFEGS